MHTDHRQRPLTAGVAAVGRRAWRRRSSASPTWKSAVSKSAPARSRCDNWPRAARSTSPLKRSRLLCDRTDCGSLTKPTIGVVGALVPVCRGSFPLATDNRCHAINSCPVPAADSGRLRCLLSHNVWRTHRWLGKDVPFSRSGSTSWQYLRPCGLRWTAPRLCPSLSFQHTQP